MSVSFPKIEFDIEYLNSKIKNEIPIEEFIQDNLNKTANKPEENDDLFSIKELLSENESTSLYYKTKNQRVFVSIYGPKDVRLREKLDNEKATIELNIKYSEEIALESQEFISEKVRKIIDNVIKKDSYPRCQITVTINVFINEIKDKFLLLPHICNAVITSICLSGINLQMLCIGKAMEYNDNKFLVIFDIIKHRKKIFDFECEKPCALEDVEVFLRNSEKSIDGLYKHLRDLLAEKV